MAVFVKSEISGDLTKAVYKRIRDHEYDDAKELLQMELQFLPKSRALLSLLAHCQYLTEDFELAAELYAQLSSLCPCNVDYKVAQAQSLFKCGDYDASLRILDSLTEETEASAQLRMAIAYQIDDLQSYRSLLSESETQDVEFLINKGCLLSKEGDYHGARQMFMEALELTGFQVDLAYNCAVCCYELKEMGPALEYLSAILDYSAKEYPEFQTGNASYGSKKIKNTRRLKDSYLIEALNLKTAIEFRMQNFKNAKNTFSSLPEREDSDLDPVTLYNSALLSSEEDPESCFEKLRYLLLNPPFPAETIETLLALYCQPQHGLYHRAADLLAEHPDLITHFVQSDTREFVEAVILRDSSSESCLARLEGVCQNHISRLRKLKRQPEGVSADDMRSNDRSILSEYRTELQNYISTLMTTAHILFEQGHFLAVERLFLTSVEFCADHPTWRTNLGHTFFVQGNKFEEAIGNYESLLRNQESSLLEIQAVILANLCTSYIMTNQNHLAEEIMRNVELEESEVLAGGIIEHPVHLCVINLVIGTLYCSKGNFDFGISRVMKSFEPFEAKLDLHTWHYAKKCFISLLDALTTHLTFLEDERVFQIVEFLEEVEHFGIDLKTETQTKTIGEEARILKNVLSLVLEENSSSLE